MVQLVARTHVAKSILCPQWYFPGTYGHAGGNFPSKSSLVRPGHRPRPAQQCGKKLGYLLWRRAADFDDDSYVASTASLPQDDRILFRYEWAEVDFPSYCFIEPTYFGSGQNDQLPPSDVLRG
jgi:hypothetical protein